jgi:hypothetical protein
MTRKFWLSAAIALLLPFRAHATCADYRTSVYSNMYGVNVSISGFPTQMVSSAFQAWNSGCGMGGGFDYPVFDFDNTFQGRISVQYVLGHRSEPIPGTVDDYPRGQWDPTTRTITIWEQAGHPPNFGSWDNYSDAQKIATLQHEFGHALGLRDDACFGGIMNSPPPSGAGITPDECTAADEATHVLYEGTSRSGCQDFWDCHMSPIILDLAHNGMHLTGTDDGVWFDLDGDGNVDRIGWTTAGADEAFLWLDSNGNGVVDTGAELFGSAMDENGFEALANFDLRDEGDIAWGGNADGVIDAQDKVWPHLRLWVDANHDGVSQPEEIFTADQKGVKAIEVGYRWSGRRDAHDNQFRYRAQVAIEHNGHVVTGEAYDVFFKVGH